MPLRFDRLLPGLLLVGAFGAPIAAHAADAPETPCESEICQSVRSYWKTVRHDTSDAAHWTAKTGEKGWDATRKGAVDAARWTGREGSEGWHATKTGVKDAAHDTAHWTRKTAHDVGKWGKDVVNPPKTQTTPNAPSAGN